MGYGLEVDMMSRGPRADLLTTPYVFNADEAQGDDQGRRRYRRGA